MEVLSDAGYRTHGIGKCHFSPDPMALRGFQSRETQEEIPSDPDHDDYLTYIQQNGFDHVIDPHGVRGEMYYVPQVSQLPASLHPSQWVGDRTAAFIEDRAGEAQPWYLFTSFVHPHPPFSPPAPWHKLYGIDQVPLPKMPYQQENLLTYVNRAQNRYKYRDHGMDFNLLRLIRAYYYSSISFIDYQIGRILSTLDATGLAENTLVIFASDHGEYLGDYGCFGKRGMHDSSARVPFVLSLPGVFDGGTIDDTPVSLIDIAPTILEAAQCDTARTPSHHLDGRAIQDLLMNGAKDEAVFSHLAFTPDVDGTRGASFQSEITVTPEERAASSLYMMVNRDYKYIYSAMDDREYLFDRRIDPEETRNRAHTPNYASRTEQMRSTVIQHLRDGGETAGIAETTNTWKSFPTKTLDPDPDYGLLIQNQPWADSRIPGYRDT
jgi:arylsulfatase A-like enzyme